MKRSLGLTGNVVVARLCSFELAPLSFRGGVKLRPKIHYPIDMDRNLVFRLQVGGLS